MFPVQIEIDQMMSEILLKSTHGQETKSGNAYFQIINSYATAAYGYNFDLTLYKQTWKCFKGGGLFRILAPRMNIGL